MDKRKIIAIFVAALLILFTCTAASFAEEVRRMPLDADIMRDSDNNLNIDINPDHLKVDDGPVLTLEEDGQIPSQALVDSDGVLYVPAGRLKDYVPPASKAPCVQSEQTASEETSVEEDKAQADSGQSQEETNRNALAMCLFLFAITCFMLGIITQEPIFTVLGFVLLIMGWIVV